MAGISQGVAHRVTLQASTLGSHEQNETESREKKLGFESAHVVFFPCLCIHSLFESVDDFMHGRQSDISPPVTADSVKVES